MKKLRILVLSCIVAFASGCASSPVTVTGTVCDATMNGLSVIIDGTDTIYISTADADLQTPQGILLYDSVEVTYVEQRSEGVAVRKAQSLNVIFSPYTAIVGRWVEPNPINAEQVQGIEINADGTAASINMATLQFEGWTLTSPDSVAFDITSIGNGTSQEMTDEYAIELLDSQNLVLSRNGNVIWNLHKEKTE